MWNIISYGSLRRFIAPRSILETPRLQVALKVLPGIPFLKKTEFISILDPFIEVAALAAIFRPYGAHQ